MHRHFKYVNKLSSEKFLDIRELDENFLTFYKIPRYIEWYNRPFSSIIICWFYPLSLWHPLSKDCIVKMAKKWKIIFFLNNGNRPIYFQLSAFILQDWIQNVFWLINSMSIKTRWSVKSVTRTRTGNLRKCPEPEIFYYWYHLLCIFIYLKHIDYNKMSKYIQKVERCSFMISRSVKCVIRTTKVDNSVFPEPKIFSFITRFLLENRVFLHLKRLNHNNFY